MTKQSGLPKVRVFVLSQPEAYLNEQSRENNLSVKDKERIVHVFLKRHDDGDNWTPTGDPQTPPSQPL